MSFIYATSTHNYFSNQGIPGPKPIPFFVFRISEYDVALVKQYGKVFGYFDGLTEPLDCRSRDDQGHTSEISTTSPIAE
ncbi:hypothetical protein DAPPUDRAFT_311608 [Daphnia pulex]|uniref:Uncharacterized protein n=1 Tax=Daphnia pulex TaxID=6669 RepID=E9FXD9_DAPPU|nr:hypothetical protein DAPPUDRAFT_311608 [Daphnia pulex]|eukprot:EFX88284.1 hypothetical protein DAPPUDRAFT_311608 [Daphnia pulex]